VVLQSIVLASSYVTGPDDVSAEGASDSEQRVVRYGKAHHCGPFRSKFAKAAGDGQQREERAL
jgi:hypothetical protein